MTVAAAIAPEPPRLDVASLLDPHVQSDPRPLYALLDETAPVHRMSDTGMSVVSRYDDLRAVLRDHASVSNDVIRPSATGRISASAGCWRGRSC